MEKIIVNSDALDIVSRIKKWNKNYEIYYNLKTKKYMLYLFENKFKPCEYLLTYPFDAIDERMFDYTLKSEIQNRNYVLKEMEESNEKLLKDEQKKYLNKMENEIGNSKRCN